MQLALGSGFHGYRPAVDLNQRILLKMMSDMLGALTRRLVQPKTPVLIIRSDLRGYADSAIPLFDIW